MLKHILFLMCLTSSTFPAVLGSPIGRFVLGQVSDSCSAQYLVDTQTGKIWHLKVAKGENVLVPVTVVEGKPSDTLAGTNKKAVW